MLMAKSSKSTENARTMLRDLLAVEGLVASLSATAPVAIAAAGGAHLLVASYGQPTGACFWSIMSIPEILWVQMAEEHQARHRANTGH
jgi:hypothetical protein